MPHPMLFEEMLLAEAYVSTYDKDGKPTRKGTSEKALGSDEELAGAVLAELAMSGRIRVELAKPEGFHTFHPSKDTVVVTDPTPLGDSIADTALTRVAEHPDWSLSTAVVAVAYHPLPASEDNLTSWQRMLRGRLLNRFVEQGTLRVHRHRILWVFPARYYPLVDPAVTADTLARLEDVRAGVTPEPRTAALSMLLIGPPHKVRPQGFPEAAGDRPRELWESLRDGQWGTQTHRQTMCAILHASRHDSGGGTVG